MKNDRQQLTNHILHNIEEIYKMFGPAVPEEWLSSNLTVTQLRVLLILRASDSLKMSDIAAKLNVTLPTTTIIVNNLVRKNLVQRDVSPEDRRIVLCRLSAEGQALIDKIWGFGRFAIAAILEGLTEKQLRSASELADQLLNSVSRFKQTAK